MHPLPGTNVAAHMQYSGLILRHLLTATGLHPALTAMPLPALGMASQLMPQPRVPGLRALRTCSADTLRHAGLQTPLSLAACQSRPIMPSRLHGAPGCRLQCTGQAAQLQDRLRDVKSLLPIRAEIQIGDIQWERLA